MVEIRECRAEDSQRIYEINKYAFGYDYPPDKTRVRLEQILARPTDRVFVACVDGFAAGYLHGCDYECTYSDPLKNIMAIAVDERFRGMGIGRALLESLEDWARDCGCCGVRLVSGFNRTHAHGFYQHCGYTLRKDQKNFIKYFQG